MTLPENLGDQRLARIWINKDYDVVLIAFEGKRQRMCEMCRQGNVKYNTHFILKARHKDVLPKRIYRLCGSKECQAKALKDYMKKYVGSKEKSNGGKQTTETENKSSETTKTD